MRRFPSPAEPNMMVRLRKWLPGVIALVTAVPICTTAATARPAAFLTAGSVADAPAGFVQLCGRDYSLCRAGIAEQPPHAPSVIAAAPRPTVTCPQELGYFPSGIDL